MHTIGSIPVGTIFRVGKLIMQKVTADVINKPIKDSKPNVVNLIDGHRCTMLSEIAVTPVGTGYDIPEPVELPPLKPLSIQRVLNEQTRVQEVVVSGSVYSLHQTPNEVLITDTSDYDKIYQVTSRSFFARLEGE